MWETLQELALEYNNILVFVHLLGVGIGFGGAMLSDGVFMYYFRDNKLTDSEVKTLGVLSNAIWVGLGLFILSGIGFILRSPEYYLNDGALQFKLALVGVIALNGLALHMFIRPNMKNLATTKKSLLPLASTLGAISVVTWVTVLIIGSQGAGFAPATTILSYYFPILAVAILVSNGITQYISRS